MPERVIVFAGDSITDCGHLFEPTHLGTGYVSMVQERIPRVRVVNSGFDGYIASRVCRNWGEICVKFQPDVVTLLVGVNDVCAYLCGGGGYDTSGYAGYIEEIIFRTQRETSAKMILMEPFLFPRPEEYQNWFSTLALFRGEMRRLAAKYGITFIPLWDVFCEAQKSYSLDELSVDGIHLAEKGHEILCETWLNCYKQLKD